MIKYIYDNLQTEVPLRLKESITKEDLIKLGFRETVYNYLELRGKIKSPCSKNHFSWTRIAVDFSMNKILYVNSNSLDILYDLIKKDMVRKMNTEEIEMYNKELTFIVNKYKEK